MDKRRTISVAMATYNGEQYLQEQLNSFVSQIWPPDELVISDDKSTDNTVKILREFQSNSPFPVKILENTLQVSVNRNFERAINCCVSDIIALSDQDDVWYPEKLHHLMQEFDQSEGIDAIFCDAEVVDDSLQPMGYRLSQILRMTGKTKIKFIKGRIFADLTTKCSIAAMSMAFRSHWKHLICPIPDYMDSNHDLWIGLLIAAAGSIRFLDQPLVYYRQHDSNFIGAVRNRNKPERSQYSRLQKKRRKLEQDIQRVRLNQEVRVRLAGQALSAARQKEWRVADKRVKHLEARNIIRQCPFGPRRLILVLRELLSLRYFLHSASKPTQFIKDLRWP